jgi:hypothetical protein
MQLTEHYTQPIREESLPQIKKISSAAYLLLSLPLGIVYFTFVVAGVTLSVSLTPIFIGIPLLFIVLTALGGMMRFERSMALAVLGEQQQPTASSTYDGTGMFRRLGGYLINPRTYMSLLLFILKLPLGIINFVVTVTFFCVSLALILAPAIYWVIEQTLGINIFEHNALHLLINYQVSPLQESLMCSALGIVLMLITVAVIRIMAEVSARITLLAVEDDL